ncbi:hypothetical protein QR98_0002870 [Sarcoptes scabiei]|uniref:Uncharacterized protein n=1 Tax=Sarcoptes scabiei TaxID=52283 RepID=A0A131ZT02_SARSC|nr:hypothetical protein QR98_0002870 [Sarcoptes scabiei]
MASPLITVFHPHHFLIRRFLGHQTLLFVMNMKKLNEGMKEMNNFIPSVQHQMASKGGYDLALPVKVSIPCVDVKN